MATSFVLRVILNLFFIAPFFLSINSEPTYLNRIIYGSDMGTYNFPRDNVPANITNFLTQLKKEASKSYYSLNSVGVGLNKFIAFFSCRYDISLRACQSCVADAVESMYSNLPSIRFFIIYEECILGYSNSSEPDLGLNAMSVSSDRTRPKIDDEAHFDQVLRDTISELISNAIVEFNKSSRYYALTTANYSSHETIYALAQCNPDMSSSNCTTCLQDRFSMVESKPSGVVYGQMFSPNCRLSYIFSTKELSRPWNFQQTYEQIYPTSTGRRGSSIIGAMIAATAALIVSLKLLL